MEKVVASLDRKTALTELRPVVLTELRAVALKEVRAVVLRPIVLKEQQDLQEVALQATALGRTVLQERLMARAKAVVALATLVPVKTVRVEQQVIAPTEAPPPLQDPLPKTVEAITERVVKVKVRKTTLMELSLRIQRARAFCRGFRRRLKSSKLLPRYSSLSSQVLAPWSLSLIGP